MLVITQEEVKEDSSGASVTLGVNALNKQLGLALLTEDVFVQNPDKIYAFPSSQSR